MSGGRAMGEIVTASVDETQRAGQEGRRLSERAPQADHYQLRRLG